MDAIVEVTTAKAVAHTNKVLVVTTISNFPKVIAPVVVTSTQHVHALSIGGTSLSAVSPDHILRNGGLAWA